MVPETRSLGPSSLKSGNVSTPFKPENEKGLSYTASQPSQFPPTLRSDERRLSAVLEDVFCVHAQRPTLKQMASNRIVGISFFVKIRFGREVVQKCYSKGIYGLTSGF
jgi:hypothetical protein